MSAFRLLALPLGLGLLAGCGGGDSPQPGADNAAAAPAPPAAANQATAAAAADEAGQLEARARAALAAVVAGAATVPLLGVRAGVGGAVCGEVGTDAGFRGFVAPPEGRPVVARSEGLDLDDFEDPYPGLYIRWCASGAELIALRPQLEGTAGAPEGDEPAPAEAAPTPAAPAPKAAPAPRRPAPPPTGRFSDAVIRPGER